MPPRLRSSWTTWVQYETGVSTEAHCANRTGARLVSFLTFWLSTLGGTSSVSLVVRCSSPAGRIGTILTGLEDTADSWALQTGLHALATLERGGLGCIPVHKGADYPIVNTPGLFQTWELIHGALAWQGAFAPENLTLEALGNDPTSGNPDRISRAAFYEGFPVRVSASGADVPSFDSLGRTLHLLARTPPGS